MSTYVWVYENREHGRPIGLRLLPYDQVSDEMYVLSARFATPEQAAAALGFYMEFDMKGYSIINDHHAGKPIGWIDRFQIATQAAPFLVWFILLSGSMAILTFIILLIHIFS